MQVESGPPSHLSPPTPISRTRPGMLQKVREVFLSLMDVLIFFFFKDSQHGAWHIAALNKYLLNEGAWHVMNFFLYLHQKHYNNMFKGAKVKWK